MSDRAQQIKALKDILITAKSIFCKNDNFDRKKYKWLYRDTLDAFSYIGKEKFYELAPYVNQFIKCPNIVLKEAAIVTLGLSTRLHLPEFKDVAYKIWLEDKDDIVKNAALRSWASYYNNTKNSEILKKLYRILMDENYAIDHRRVAMQDIFYVAGETPKFYDPFQDRHLYMLNSHEEFNQKIDWDEIKAIIKKYAPGALI